jgi:hypothetical protein
VNETPEDLRRRQRLLDDSAAGRGEHLRSIITEEQILGAEEFFRRLQGMPYLSLLP